VWEVEQAAQRPLPNPPHKGEGAGQGSCKAVRPLHGASFEGLAVNDRENESARSAGPIKAFFWPAFFVLLFLGLPFGYFILRGLMREQVHRSILSVNRQSLS
jgi:hypothetical protein